MGGKGEGMSSSRPGEVFAHRVQSGWHVAILIPARNEEKLLPRCLASVQIARNQLKNIASSEIIVVSDCSTDQTLEVAATGVGKEGLVISSCAGNVGSARQLAAKAALQRTSVDPDRCWLANTDADCVVPLTWLSHQLSLAHTGVHAVTGIVDVDSFEEHSALVPSRFRSTYHTYQDGTHPHVHGANLGVRADAYLEAGGWYPEETAEDHDLWNRLAEGNWLRRADARLVVLTSGRRIGRAPNGFAAALAAHNRENAS